MSWSTLPHSEAQAFLDRVRDENEPFLFDHKYCEVHTLPLEFYDGYELYRIVHKYMLPHFILDFIGNGEDFYYLDGSDVPFQNLNARQAISLNEHDIVDYFSFYISYVYERGNSFEISRSQDPDIRLKLYDVTDGVFDLEANLLYQGKAHRAEIKIHKYGQIDIIAPIKISFLSEPKPRTTYGFRHPHEDKIIEDTSAILSSTSKGRYLLNLMQDYAGKVRVFNSPNYMGISTPDNLIYMTMPVIERTAKHAQAIVLASHIQDIHQNMSDFTRPAHTGDPQDYALLNYGKNLDMILESCIMVEELEKQNATGAVKEIRAMGFGPLYERQKTEKETDVLMPLYLSILKEID